VSEEKTMRARRICVIAAAAALALFALPPAAQGAAGDIDVSEFTVTPLASAIAPDPTQAGAHPNMRIFMRFCDKNLPDAGRGAGCTTDQKVAPLKDFTLHLPPGLLGNPTAVPICPTFLFLAASCPPESAVGHSLSIVSPTLGGENQLDTPIFNVQTLGLEPARLGTTALGSNPPGPFPILIGLRTADAAGESAGASGDFGVDSTLRDLPLRLGVFGAKVVQIDTVLCSQAPCAPTDRLDPSTVQPLVLPGVTPEPFFVNPTSCAKAANLTLETRSYQTSTITTQTTNKTQHWEDTTQPPDGTLDTLVTDPRTDAFVPSGCTDVNATSPTPKDTPAPGANPPFNLNVDVTPENRVAGAPSGYHVLLHYPDYANDTIWQSQLRDAEVTLPEGVSLATGGGIGLEACSSQQFYGGADFAHRTNDPVHCPPGSQIGTLKVKSPALPQELEGRAFFGPPTAPGQPTAASPWKLFLLIEGAGLRIKLPAGDVTLTDSGQIKTVFKGNPQVPFTTFELDTRGVADGNPVLSNPSDCETHSGSAVLTSWGDTTASTPTLIRTPTVKMTTGCPPKPFQPVIEDASAVPSQAGASSVSHLLFNVPDGNQLMRTLKLSLPPGAVGSLAAAQLCPAATVNALASNPAVNCPVGSKVGTIKTTVGSGTGLLTTPGSVYIGEATQPGDAASFVIVVPAKVGPLDLGRVVLVNRATLRPTDTGVDVVSPDIPKILDGIPLPIRKVEITVDRPGFFLNPTSCDKKQFVATFTSYESPTVASATFPTQATGCENLAFHPNLRLIGGGEGLTDKDAHPSLKAIVTQDPGQANIAKANVILPDIIRPNVPQIQKPGVLCSDITGNTCPPTSQIGTANVITPVLPFALSGPVYIVLKAGNPLPNLVVFLRGGGLEVKLNASNGFSGIKIQNIFDGLPDVPQARFELNVKGGPTGILNAFSDLCTTKPLPKFDATFTGQNGKVVKETPRFESDGCISSSARVSISGRRVKMSRSGIVGIRVTCPPGTVACRGTLKLQTANAVKTSKRRKVTLGSKSFSIPAGKTKTVKVKLSKKNQRIVKHYKHLRVRVAAKLKGARTTRRTITVRG
jgi:hypothetical protein